MNVQFQPGTVSKGVIATSLYCDTAGRIWLTTSNERGLFMYSDGLFRVCPELDAFGNYLVSAISQDLKGDFWIGMGNDGLLRLRNGQATKVATGTFLDKYSTWSIFADKNGTVWFGSEGGLGVLDGGVFYENKMEGLASAKINKIIIVLKNYLPGIPPHWSIFLKFSP